MNHDDSSRAPISRRNALRAVLIGSAALAAPTLAAGRAAAAPAAEPTISSIFNGLLGQSQPSTPAPAPGAASGDLGSIIDYAAGIPDPAAIKADGYIGAIRYVSDRRPGGEWMLGKPLLADEAQRLRAAGLAVASNYQFGKDDTSDWLGGFDVGVNHAKRGNEIHLQAGGPADKPIYVSIDSNPTEQQLNDQVIPYLKAWNSIIGLKRTGVYGNSGTIDKCIAAGVATWFWQHDWGTPKGFEHPAAHLHQIPGENQCGGVGVDVNKVLKPDWGQW